MSLSTRLGESLVPLRGTSEEIPLRSSLGLERLTCFSLTRWDVFGQRTGFCTHDMAWFFVAETSSGCTFLLFRFLYECSFTYLFYIPPSFEPPTSRTLTRRSDAGVRDSVGAVFSDGQSASRRDVSSDGPPFVKLVRTRFIVSPLHHGGRNGAIVAFSLPGCIPPVLRLRSISLRAETFTFLANDGSTSSGSLLFRR